MKILGIKPGHDGALALIEDGRLCWSLEAEKDSGPRHGAVTAELMASAMSMLDGPIDVVALGGWHRIVGTTYGSSAAGYFGTATSPVEASTWNGVPVLRSSTTHERSHVLASLAMAPGAPLRDAAVLVWEGVIGSWYRWSDPVGSPVTLDAFPVLDQPGARYSSLYALADPNFPATGEDPPTEFAGKLMALAGCADGVPPDVETRAVVDHLVSRSRLYPLAKVDYRRWSGYDAGVETIEFARAARYLGDRLFGVFADAAKRVLPAGLPLVVGGGCGLNCDWNTRLVELGWFSDVFVPPCPDDSGSAIGAAVGAQVAVGGPVAIEWSVDSGPAFVDPDARRDGWTARAASPRNLAAALAGGAVVAWVEGRCEIGPRALGHRSLLASAHDPTSTATLNRIKGRESYRPVAPLCRADAAPGLFDGVRLDPHMLYFSKVRDPGRLPAITHSDGSARVQALERGRVPHLDALLDAVGGESGDPVVCNTSLNHHGRGFINRSDDLFAFCESRGLAHAVIDGIWHERE